jgi:hypothetical protein
MIYQEIANNLPTTHHDGQSFEIRIESLRLILEKQQHRSISFNEAHEIGDSLIAFYEVLGQGGQNEPAI